MNAQEYQEYWANNGGLRRWSTVNIGGLSEDNNRAMFSIGFPIGNACGFGMVDPARLISDGVYCVSLYNEYGQISVLDGHAVICADGSSEGYFANASLLDFLYSITIVHEASVFLKSCPAAEYDAAVRRSKERLKLIDATAFDRENSFWPLLYESFGVVD